MSDEDTKWNNSAGSGISDWRNATFIQSPTSRLLDITAYAIIGMSVVCLFLGRIIKIDETVKGAAEIRVAGGVREVVSPIDGLVNRIFKKLGDQVKPAELIARIEMDDYTATEVQKLSDVVESFTKKVEGAHSPLELNLQAFEEARTAKIYEPTILQSLVNVEHSVRDFQLIRDQTLTNSEGYYTNQRIRFLQNRLNKMKSSSQHQLLASYIDSTEEELGRLKTQVATTRIKTESTLNQSFADLLRNLRIAHGALDDYRKRHEVRAPIAGVIGKIIFDNVHIGADKTVAVVIPADAHFIARVTMRSKDIVKVKEGQVVYYKVEAYPFQRFGLFDGRVINFEQIRDPASTTSPGMDNGAAAAVDDDSFNLTASIDPPTRLGEDLQSRIKFIFGMKAEATIVLDRKSINDIIYDELFKLKDL